MSLNMTLQTTYAAIQEVFPLVPERIKTDIKVTKANQKAPNK